MSARVLVVGLDGAEWSLIRQFGEEDLPNLHRLAREGSSAPLCSTTPPMTLPSWSSCLTGCHPGTHGILDFTARVPGTYRLAFQDASSRRVPTIHRVLAERGRSVASIAVPTTWPPEDLPNDGVVVSGFDSPVATRAEAAHCQPRALHAEIERRFGGLRYADFQEGDPSAPGWHAHARNSLLREIARKEALCAWLLGTRAWDLFMVVLGESDTAAHHFWHLHDEGSPRRPAGGRHPQADTLREVYRRLDATVGRLAKHAEHVCIVSDHGFGGSGTMALYLNRFLEAQGWLAFHDSASGGGGGPPVEGSSRRAAILDRVRQAAMRLPVERVVRRIPGTWLGRVESAARWGNIDFARTRAWSDELNYAATVHLNVAGRDPLGTVGDVDAAIAELRRLLLDWRIEGKPVVKAVHTRAEAFPGPGGACGPDLVLELTLEDGYSRTLLPSARVPAGTTWRRLAPQEFHGGKGLGMAGSHRQHGVLVLHGPGVRTGVELPAAAPLDLRDDDTRGPCMADVAPTLLHLLGEAIPPHVEGRVLAAAVREAPERRDETDAPGAWGGGGPAPLRNASPGAVRRGLRATTSTSATVPRDVDAREEASLRERLERLGYL